MKTKKEGVRKMRHTHKKGPILAMGERRQITSDIAEGERRPLDWPRRESAEWWGPAPQQAGRGHGERREAEQ